MNEESKKELLNLKGNLLTYLQKQPYYQPNRKGFFLCQDPEHQDTNPSMMFNKKNNTCHCFSCGATHDLFWFIQRDFKLQSFGEAVDKAKELFDGSVMNTSIKKNYVPTEKNFLEYFNKIKNDRPVEYLKKRGLNDWLIDVYDLYFDKEHQSLIIPTSKSSYTERFLKVDKDTSEFSRYKHFGSSHIFDTFPNPERFLTNIPPIYIVEGELDALSILAGSGLGENKNASDKIKSGEIHALSIGLGSANNTYLLINELKKLPSEILQKYNFVLALDNDRAGKTGTEKLAEELTKLNAKFVSLNPYGNYKDANEALVNDKEKLKNNLENIYNNYNKILTGENTFFSEFDVKDNFEGEYLKISFISEDLKNVFKNYVNKHLTQTVYTDQNDLFIYSNPGIIPKSKLMGLLNEQVYPSLEDYAAFNNMFLQKTFIKENQLNSFKASKDTPSAEITNDLITAKLKYLISDAYKTYYGVDLSDAYISSDDIYYHIENLKKRPLKYELSESEKTIYEELMKSIAAVNSKFENYHTNYKKLTKDLLNQIKQENIKLDLTKEKLKALGILNESNTILKYPEFYKVLTNALNSPISNMVQSDNPSSVKTPLQEATPSSDTKYVNTKLYEKNVPYVLRNLPIFCCWKNVWDEKRNSYVKMPINPKNGHRAMTNEEERCFPPVYDENKQIVFDTYKDASGKERRKIRRNFDGQFDLRRLSDDMCSWTDFKTACEAVDKWGCDGIGINAIKHLNLFLIDLDDVKEETGELNPLAKEFIQQIPTYTEYSPSGKGIHMIGYADIDEKRAIRKDKVELYSAKHFITLTGNLVEGVPVKVCNKKSATPAINALIQKYLGLENNSEEKNYFHQQSSKYKFPEEVNQQGFDNQTIIKRCSAMYELKKNQYNGLNIFDELYDKGNWQQFFPSQSDADLFLVGRFKFFTTSKSQVDELFRSSGLMRDKWDQSVGSGFPYGMNTINYCFSKQQYSYTKSPNLQNKSIKE